MAFVFARLCPGSTTTEFQQVANQPDRVFRVAETAEKVARVGLEGLAAGKTCVISGTMNRLMMQGKRLASRRFVTKMAAKMMRPGRLLTGTLERRQAIFWTV